MQVIESQTLYSDRNGSDKVYVVEMVQDDAYRFKVRSWSGKYNGGAYRGSLVDQGAKVEGVDECEALVAFKKLVSSKIKGSSKYRVLNDATSTIALAVQTERDGKSAGVPVPLLTAVSESVLHELLQHKGMYWSRKMNGVRRGAISKNGDVIGFKRSNEFVSLMPAIADAVLKAFGHDAIVDGELVGDTLYLFDMQRLNGEDLTACGFKERYDRLRTVGLANEDIVYTPANVFASFATSKTVVILPMCGSDEALRFFEALREINAEGIVGRNGFASVVDGKFLTSMDSVKFKFYEMLSAKCIKHNQKHSVEVALLDGAEWKDMCSVTIPASMALPTIGSIIELRYLPARVGRKLDQPSFQMVRDDIGLDACTMDQVVYEASHSE